MRLLENALNHIVWLSPFVFLIHYPVNHHRKRRIASTTRFLKVQEGFGKMSLPELGSKISLISKADIRYEGRLFTVDPQECTIALANGEYWISQNLATKRSPWFSFLREHSKGYLSHPPTCSLYEICAKKSSAVLCLAKCNGTIQKKERWVKKWSAFARTHVNRHCHGVQNQRFASYLW